MLLSVRAQRPPSPPSPSSPPYHRLHYRLLLFRADDRYDLTFQFDSIPLKHERDGSQKDLLLYLPDKILVVDQASSPSTLRS